MGIEPVTPPGEDKSKSDADDSPRAAAPPRPGKRATPGMRQLHEKLTELYVSLGAMVVTPLDRLAGTLMVAQADELAQSWCDLAETNPSVKKALQKLVEAGGWGGVVIAHGMILLPVLANRGMFPDHVAAFAAMGTVAANQEQVPNIANLFDHPRFNPQPPAGSAQVA